ncbi:hypothetical protein K6119_15045 [Paracrocinitomix mangrovi]|uniref:hypothetical protein n=1 Tax=Paracrocinitomix mangrovi TaxID=2862509 RepID=UPI001C8EDC53|nr:hypothetical protein [Paracrocinitomix mangrovi]UKN01045.1 hypothetical protein K6119_15045 [Paracrocinitomix mangrovi]
MASIQEKILPKKVFISLFFIPMAVPFFGLYIDILQIFDGFLGGGGFETFLLMSTLGLVYGAIIWIPTVLLCLAFEAIILTNMRTRQALFGVLAAEALIATFLIPYLLLGDMGFFGFGNELVITLGLAVFTTQGLRTWYLLHKGRVFTTDQVKAENTDLIDDFDMDDQEIN